jgi:hypothetical protein
MSRLAWHLNAFGLDVEADFALPDAVPDPSRGASQRLRIREAAWSELIESGAHACLLRSLLAIDGVPFAVLESADGAVVFHYGREATFRLSADRGELLCSPGVDGNAVSLRVLLDTVLWTVSLFGGTELLHASAVETETGVVAFVAGSGCGKSSLAAAFLRQGADLFADDVVALRRTDTGQILAFPGPRLMNLPSSIDPSEITAVVPLHRFPSENWVSVPGRRLIPQPLAAIVHLERRHGSAIEFEFEPGSALWLLPQMAFLAAPGGLPNPRPERDFSRFTLAAELLRQTPAFSLTAGWDVRPAELVEVVKKGMASR